MAHSTATHGWSPPMSAFVRSSNAIERTRASGRERQFVMRDPSTGARLTGSLLSAAGAR
jgi:hypothetical protein